MSPLNFACFSMVNSAAGHNLRLVDSSDVEPRLTRVKSEFSTVQRVGRLLTRVVQGSPVFIPNHTLVLFARGDNDTGSRLH